LEAFHSQLTFTLALSAHAGSPSEMVAAIVTPPTELQVKLSVGVFCLNLTPLTAHE
jgi:hypothetical protein